MSGSQLNQSHIGKEDDLKQPSKLSSEFTPTSLAFFRELNLGVTVETERIEESSSGSRKTDKKS